MFFDHTQNPALYRIMFGGFHSLATVSPEISLSYMKIIERERQKE